MGDQVNGIAGPEDMGSHFVVRSFKNGAYTGRIDKGKLNGKGRYSFYTGELYDGEWKDNKMHGDGEYTYGDGSRFKGEFRDGLKHGVGTYFPIGEEAYVAQYHEGNLIAQGSAVTFDSRDRPNVIDATTDDLVPNDDDDSAVGYTPFEKAMDGFSLEKVLAAATKVKEEVDVHQVGVGIVFQQREEGGVLVKQIVGGGPASRSKRKIKPRDFLTHVNGEDVRESEIEAVAALVKGDEGTSVEMHFVRSVHGHSRPVHLTLERGRIDPFLAAEQKKQAQSQTAWSSESSLKIEEDEDLLQLAAGMQGMGHEESEPTNQAASEPAPEYFEEFAEVPDEGAEDEDDEQWFQRVASTHSIYTEAICVADLGKDAALVNFPTPATVVYLNFHRKNLAPMFKHPMLGPQLNEHLIQELSELMRVPKKALQIVDFDVTYRSRFKRKIIMGQVANCPGDEEAWHDPKNKVLCSRAHLHIKQKTNEGGKAPSSVVHWQQSQAEHLERDFLENARSFKRYKYLSQLFEVELKGCADGSTDLDLEHMDDEYRFFLHNSTSEGWQRTERVKQSFNRTQVEAQDESRAIWSQRFLNKYGNPTMLVLSQADHLELVNKQPVAITAAEVQNTSKFHVIKRLNLFEDGPRVLTLDRINKCMINEANEDKISKVLQGDVQDEHGKQKQAVERKRIPFANFVKFIPHEARPEHLTIRFKKQRDYEVDFESQRERELFQLCLKPWVAESCWETSGLEEHGIVQHPKMKNGFVASDPPSLMRSIALYRARTGRIPTTYDRGGHPEAAIQDPFAGNTSHPLAKDGENQTAFHVLVPANAKTPLISYQQAAYVTQRQDLAVGYYGESAQTRVKERTPTNETQRSLLSSFAKPKDPRRAQNKQKKMDRQTAERVQKGEFTQADHVLAYKLLYGLAPDRQLTGVEVQQAVEGEYAELMVKVKAEQIMADDEAKAAVRAQIFNKIVVAPGLQTSKALLDVVEREQRGLEECRRFQEMLIHIHQGTTSEMLAHPVAFPLKRRRKRGMPAGGSASSRSSRSSRSSEAEEEEDSDEPELEQHEELPVQRARLAPVKVMEIKADEWKGAPFTAHCMGGVARAIDLQVSKKATSMFEDDVFQISLLEQGDHQLQVIAKGPPWKMKYYGGSEATIHEVPSHDGERRAYHIQRPDGEDMLMVVDTDNADPDPARRTRRLPNERSVLFSSLDQMKDYIAVEPREEGWEMSFYAPLQPAQIALGALVVTMGRFEDHSLMKALNPWSKPARERPS